MMVSVVAAGDNEEGSTTALRTPRCRAAALHLGEEQRVPKLPPVPDPQHEVGVEVGVDRTGAKAQSFDELEPEIVALVVVEPGAGGLHSDPGRAPHPIAPRGAQGANLELDLATPVVLE